MGLVRRGSGGRVVSGVAVRQSLRCSAQMAPPTVLTQINMQRGIHCTVHLLGMGLSRESFASEPYPVEPKAASGLGR